MTMKDKYTWARYDLEREEYELICQLQGMIASLSKVDEELTTSTKNKTKDSLEWMIGGVRDPKTGLSYDQNSHPLHKKLMQLYFLGQKIKESIYEEKREFYKANIDPLSKRIAHIENQIKGINERLMFLCKKLFPSQFSQRKVFGPKQASPEEPKEEKNN